MYLQTLELKNFRNFPTAQYDFSPEVNILYGPNASGKTNLLEAIYVLANLRSFRTHQLRDVIEWDQSQSYLRGSVHTGPKAPQTVHSQEPTVQEEERFVGSSGKALAVKIEPNARTAMMNGKQCRSSKDYLQVLPCTAFIPDDLELVKGMPASRRYFLDKGTFQFYPPYWSLLSDYNKLLRQKNALLRKLKDERRNQLEEKVPNGNGAATGHPCDIWNEQLQQVGSKVILHRMLFVQNIRKFLKTIYTNWLANKECVDLRYRSSIRRTTEDFAEFFDLREAENENVYESLYNAYGQALQKNLHRELTLGASVVGPHRDDLEVSLWEKSLRFFGSQGQQRTAVLALKFAEVYLYFERYGEYPVLLLDDVTSELDESRTQKLFEYVQHGMQVFISTTSKPDLPIDRSFECAYVDLEKN